MSNSTNKTISIVIATYNGAAYIKEQLDSIAAQTLQPTEIIVQDDCSSDETVAIVQTYLSRLPITLSVNPENVGYIHNFESALTKASGEYIVLCDQDDIWVPHKLERLIEAIGTKSLVYSNSYLIDSDGNPVNKTLSDKLRNRFIEASTPLSFVYDNCVSAHAMVFHRSLLPHLFPFPHHMYFDAWIAACAAASGGIAYIDEALVGYRQHACNTLNRQCKHKRAILKDVMRKHAKKINGNMTNTAIIDELLRIPNLSEGDRTILNKLRHHHAAFPSRWFNLSLMLLLIHNRSTLFAITKRNPFSLSLKKSIGLKLYRALPFL